MIELCVISCVCLVRQKTPLFLSACRIFPTFCRQFVGKITPRKHSNHLSLSRFLSDLSGNIYNSLKKMHMINIVLVYIYIEC